MNTPMLISTFLFVCALPSLGWGQAAVPLPNDDAAVPPSAPQETPATPAPGGDTTPEPQPTTPTTLAPSPLLQPETVTVANQPGTESPYVTQVGPQRSPRQAVFIGLGIGGGRMQDKAAGFGGVSFNLDVGYSITPALAVMLDLDGLVHPQGGGGDDKDENDKREAAALWHYGGALAAQLHLLDPLRVSLGVGYYALHHSAPKDANGDPIGENRTLTSLGGEFAAGFEFFQSPGGFSAGIDFRTQLAFPDQKMVTATFGLIGVRWYGIGARRG